MSTAKINLNAITGLEMSSLGDDDVSAMYDVLFGVKDDEIVRSPYEIDRDKTIYRTRQQVHICPTSQDKGTYTYNLNNLGEGRNVMDLASMMFLRDTIPAIKVKDEFAETTQIRHCDYPGHVKVESAHLYHGSDLFQTLDNIRLDCYAQTELPVEKRDFYKRMVGHEPANITWGTSLPSFKVSVPQPWHFCTIKGAELRLNCVTPTTVTYSFREEATASLRMRIQEDNQWKEVDPEDYKDRINIGTVNSKKNSVLEIHMVLHKCHEAYALQLSKSKIVVPCEEMIIMDSTDDSHTHEININSFDFVRRICILAEPKNTMNKSIYHEAVIDGRLEYKGGMKKIPNLTPTQLLLEDPWSSSYALPDRQGFYVLTLSDTNRAGSYDSAMSLGGTGTRLTIVLNTSKEYNVRVRLYVYRVLIYENNAIKVVSSLNARDYTNSQV